MKWFVFVFMVVSFLSGCGGQVKPDDGQSGAEGGTKSSKDSVVSGVKVGTVDDGAPQKSTKIDGVMRDVSYERNAIYDAANVLAERTIYFEYDSSAISADEKEIIKHHGKYLALNSTATMRIEGHTDERGSREYNVALADRRAQSVKRLLLFQGASNNQIVVISYGEEKPAAFGHDENAWQLNRRAELVYGK